MRGFVRVRNDVNRAKEYSRFTLGRPFRCNSGAMVENLYI